MDTLAAIHGRRSIRAFLPAPVPKEAIARLLEASRWAPSAVNRQGWRVTIVTGEARRELAQRLVARARERGPRTSDSQAPPTPERRRSEALTADLAELAAAQGQSRWEFVVLGSYALYDAPVVIVVSHPGNRGADVVPFVTTMLLAAHDMGLGTCWLGYPLSERDLFYERLPIPEEERIGAVIALGYPDPDAPANAYRSPRDPVESWTRWVGFDEHLQEEAGT
jgi:nitroreductase